VSGFIQYRAAFEDFSEKSVTQFQAVLNLFRGANHEVQGNGQSEMPPNLGSLVKVPVTERHHYQQIEIRLWRRLPIGMRTKENNFLRAVGLHNAITEMLNVGFALDRMTEAVRPVLQFLSQSLSL
jgi:hypothetical protein